MILIFICLEINDYNYKNKDLEKEFEFAQIVLKAIRSARSDYNIPAKTKTEAFVKCSDVDMSRILKDFKLEIETLSYCSNVEVVSDAPLGCAILSINAQCEVHLMLKGIIEVEKEVTKLEKKSEQLQSLIGNLRKKMTIEGYVTKVPVKVQEENIETVSQSEIEIGRIQAAIEALKLM